MFSSDFPHEVNVHTVKKEIHELCERNGVSDSAKQAILRDNAERFYRLREISN
jgi:predicted TIM-barrel fold metal-dependent hydrolase